MPVFNEEESVAKVLSGWLETLNREVGKFLILAIDDGSTDATGTILGSLEKASDGRLEILSHTNRGHGISCIKGYKTAIEREIPHILQIDSDGQSDPAHFFSFWEKRDDYDVIYGKRRRHDGTRRILASATLRIMLRIMARVNCVDANVPYRLMNSTKCAEAIRSVPEDVYLSNIALSVILRRNPGIRHGQIPIGFPPRMGGEPSVPFRKFAAKGFELFAQLKKAGLR